MAAACAGRRGIRAINVTGTVTLGPNCGPGVAPFTIYPLGNGTICGGYYGARAITAGSDGALWFTMPPRSLSGTGYIGRISTSGVITTYPTPGDYPVSVIAGPDGALWFSDQANLYQAIATRQLIYGGSVGRITTSGVITTFPVSGGLSNLTVGPDGALWFAHTSSDGTSVSIARMTTSGILTDFPVPGMSPISITTGPDGALWFANNGHWAGKGNNLTFVKGSIGRMTTSGVVTIFDAGLVNALNLVSGPGGQLWFTGDTNECTHCIGSVTISGTLTSYANPEIYGAEDLTTGPDGAIWFTNGSAMSTSVSDGAIGRLTPSGQVSLYTGPGVWGPEQLTSGPDNAMWFTSMGNDAIGRLAIP